MSLRVTDVIIAMRDLRDTLSTTERLAGQDADVYEELAARAIGSIRESS
jgi:hypothetical protein